AIVFHARLILQVEAQSFARLIRTHRCEERSILLVSLFDLRGRDIDLSKRELPAKLIDRDPASRSLALENLSGNKILECCLANGVELLLQGINMRRDGIVYFLLHDLDVVNSRHDDISRLSERRHRKQEKETTPDSS